LVPLGAPHPDGVLEHKQRLKRWKSKKGLVSLCRFRKISFKEIASMYTGIYLSPFEKLHLAFTPQLGLSYNPPLSILMAAKQQETVPNFIINAGWYKPSKYG
jgi:hypothetical protein